MRILGIRGKNIASLADPFAIDFRDEPLASAGLFAISGQTGAGKSAILDTLCLALYSDTPRLSAAPPRGLHLPDVGDDTVSARDSRNLLRRGASDGYAEVDFVGSDGVEYRARWSVRRARGRPTGSLRPVEMSLTRATDGVPVADGLTEVLREIESKVGLTFGQFTRAVLLAQNDFAAFLRADDNDRAALLETLTGTDVFSRISRCVFERARTERHELELLNEQLVGHHPLPEERRRDLEQQRDSAKGRIGEIEAVQREMESCLRWYTALAEMREAEAQARETLDRAHAALTAVAARRAHLTLIDAVQPARQIMADCARTEAEVSRAGRALAELHAKSQEADGIERQATLTLSEASTRVASAERIRSESSHLLDAAKALDAQIAALAPGFRQAEQVRADARRRAREAAEALASGQRERRELAAGIDMVERWCAEHPALRALSGQWHRWDTLFGHAVKVETELAEVLERVSEAGCTERTRQQVADEAVAESRAATEALEAHRAQVAAAIQRLSSFDPDNLAGVRRAAESRREALSEAQGIWNTLSREEAALKDLDVSLVTSRETLAGIERRLSACAEARTSVVSALGEAEAAMEAARAACVESVESLRHSLQPGRPCPVCGSNDHPYTATDGSLRTLLDTLRARAATLTETRDRLIVEEAALKERRQVNHARIEEARSARPLAEKAAGEAGRAWQASSVYAEVAHVSAVSVSAWLASALQVVGRSLESVRGQEEEYRRVLKEYEAARSGMQVREREVERLRERVGAAQSDVVRAEEAARTAVARSIEVGRRRDGILNELDAAFSDADWRGAWAEDPREFHASRKAEVEEWNARAAALSGLRSQIDHLDAELTGRATASREAEERAALAAEEMEKAQGELDEKRRQRQELLEGRPAADVEAELTTALAAARQQEVEASEVARRAAERRARASEALAQARLTIEELEGKRGQAFAALSGWIARFNETERPEKLLDIDRLGSLLSKPAQWIAGERTELKAREEAAQRAVAVLSERRRQLEAHEAKRPTEAAKEAVTAGLASVLVDLDAARARLTSLEADVKTDDDKRRHTAALGTAIRDRETRERVWARLSELVGSLDGRKFRNYAQQLTLEVLLGYSNRHLSGLSRRYRLDWIPNTLALVVVDQDMGDEVRSVHSLSGGESFLMSLALALGLASLSSGRVRVESLFIDEGFGSLDADTLRIAMDALDSLQALGRKVGVISHVEEMTERIGARVHVRKLAGGRSVVVVGRG